VCNVVEAYMIAIDINGCFCCCEFGLNDVDFGVIAVEVGGTLAELVYVMSH